MARVDNFNISGGILDSWTSLSAALLSCIVLAWVTTSVFKYSRQRLSYGITARRLGAQKVAAYPHRAFSFGYDLQRIHEQSVKDGNSQAVRKDLFQQHGKTFAANWVGQSVIHTMHRDNIEVVLGTSVSSFIMSPLRNEIAEPLLGRGLLTRDGDTWQRSRSLAMQVFSKSQVANLDALEVHLQKMLALLPTDGKTVDLQPLFQKLFIDKGTEFLLGESINSLSPQDAHPDVDEFLITFEKAIRVMGLRLRMGHLRWLRGFDLKWRRDCKQVYAVVDRFVDQAEHRLQQSQNEKRQSVDTHIFLDKLLLVTQDRKEICTQLINVFLAGRDQIAIAMSLCVFAIARRPEVWAQLRSEVLSQDSRITYESLKSMNYLRGVLFESFRLYSPVLRSIRHCNSNCLLPHGGGPTGEAPILVAKGTLVDMDFGNMHRDPDVWGDDADEFVPERWIGLKNPGWDYIPFLGGRRVCPAKDMVLIQCSYVLARFAQEFSRIDNRDPEPRLVDDVRNVRMSRNGTLVALVV